MTTDGRTRRGGRRGNGEGSIAQYSDGRWVARLRLPGGRRKAFYGHTRGEVQTMLTKARADAQAGLPLPGARLTLGVWLSEWLETTAQASVRPSTFRTYSGYISKHVLVIGAAHQPHPVARRPLTKLDPRDLDRLFQDLRTAGLSPRTIEQLRAIIRRALNVAMKRGLVSRNVVTLTDPPRVERREAPALTPENARQLLDALQDEPYYPLYAVALASGLRLGEQLGLRWGTWTLTLVPCAFGKQYSASIARPDLLHLRPIAAAGKSPFRRPPLQCYAPINFGSTSGALARDLLGRKAGWCLLTQWARHWSALP
jgi:integrase